MYFFVTALGSPESQDLPRFWLSLFYPIHSLVVKHASKNILYRLLCRAAAMRGIPKTNSHRDGGEG